MNGLPPNLQMNGVPPGHPCPPGAFHDLLGQLRVQIGGVSISLSKMAAQYEYDKACAEMGVETLHKENDMLKQEIELLRPCTAPTEQTGAAEPSAEPSPGASLLGNHSVLASPWARSVSPHPPEDQDSNLQLYVADEVAIDRVRSSQNSAKTKDEDWSTRSSNMRMQEYLSARNTPGSVSSQETARGKLTMGFRHIKTSRGRQIEGTKAVVTNSFLGVFAQRHKRDSARTPGYDRTPAGRTSKGSSSSSGSMVSRRSGTPQVDQHIPLDGSTSTCISSASAGRLSDLGRKSSSAAAAAAAAAAATPQVDLPCDLPPEVGQAPPPAQAMNSLEMPSTGTDEGRLEIPHEFPPAPFRTLTRFGVSTDDPSPYQVNENINPELDSSSQDPTSFQTALVEARQTSKQYVSSSNLLASCIGKKSNQSGSNFAEIAEGVNNIPSSTLRVQPVMEGSYCLWGSAAASADFTKTPLIGDYYGQAGFLPHEVLPTVVDQASDQCDPENPLGLWPLWVRTESGSPNVPNFGRTESVSPQADGSQLAKGASMPLKSQDSMRISAVSIRLMEMAAQAEKCEMRMLLGKYDPTGTPQSLSSSTCCWRCVEAMVVHPRNKILHFWNLFGGALIAYDVLTLPLQAFEVPYHIFWLLMSWTSSMYWTLDLLFSFFKGFETDSETVVQPFHVWWNYITHWFGLDFTIVSVDWISMFMVGSGATSRGTKGLRAMRAIRSLRVIRLLRVVRLMKLLRRLQDRIRSEVITVVLKIALMMFCIATLSHYAACYWYFVGISAQEYGGALDTWIIHNKPSDAVSELYMLSLHWSLSQSGYTPSNIYPTNIYERGFASMVSLLWLLAQGLTIGIFTLLMIQLRDANRERVMEGSRLRQYLVKHQIPTELTEDVLKYFRIYSGSHAPHVHEEELPIFKDLPVDLRVVLHRQVYMPTLDSHPIFAAFACNNEIGLMSVCHLAMTEHYYVAGSELFGSGEVAKSMFYGLSGHFEYYCPSTKMFEEVPPFTWVNEPVLWRTWKQRGVLTAFSSSETVGLEAAKFHAIMEEVEDNGFSIDVLRRYGRIAAEFFAAHAPDTDLWGDDEQIKELVHIAQVHGDVAAL